MAPIDVDARLDLIQIAANAFSEEGHDEGDDQLLDLIEALCRHRDLLIEAILNEVHAEVLLERSEDEFRRFLVEHSIPPPETA